MSVIRWLKSYWKEDMKSIAADFYVIKSFDLSELKNKIAMALEANVRAE